MCQQQVNEKDILEILPNGTPVKILFTSGDYPDNVRKDLEKYIGKTGKIIDVMNEKVSNYYFDKLWYEVEFDPDPEVTPGYSLFYKRKDFEVLK